MGIQIDPIWTGAFISILTFSVNKIIDYAIDNHGDVKIYRKIVYQYKSDNKTMGVYDEGNDKVLIVPLWIEIQNTKKVPTVIRDFSLYLYDNNISVKKMKQGNFQELKNDNNIEKVFYGDNGNYSFVIPPESIKSFKLHFSMKYSDYNGNFDEIRISYYNQRDKRIIKKFKNFNTSWKLERFNNDTEWVQIK